ncbi:MAG: hypothetical protein JXB00_04740 [Bacteroidales bacterium]|nr:hypothetical protein [Bacteroidales bacterium]
MKPNQKSLTAIILLAVLVLLLTGCANHENVEACLEGYKYRFLGGLWHGIIAPIDLVISLWRDDVTVYAQNNNGAWYALGFILGSGGWGILGGKGLGCKKKKRYES